jgi:hypothetical protein
LIQSSRGPIDGAVVFATEDWLLYWQHSPQALSSVSCFADTTETLLCREADPTSISPNLSSPFDDIPISGGEFLNLQFPIL